MTKYRMSKHGTYLLKDDKKLYNLVNECDEIADLLNKLSNENEQLKSAIKDCIKISESNGALSPMRLKSIFYHFEL